MLLDRTPAPKLGSTLVHTEYADNAIGLSTVEQVAKTAVCRIRDELSRAGLPTHAPTSTRGGTALGWTFAEDNTVMGASPHIRWRIRLGMIELVG